MLCPICGREIPENSSICEFCGTDFVILQESLLPPPPPLPEKSKPRRSRPWAAVVAAVAALLVISVCISLALRDTPRMQRGFIPYQQHILVSNAENGLAVSIDGDVFYDTRDGYVSNIQRSLSGSTLAFFSGASLSVVHEGEIHSVQAVGVTNFILSADGSAVLFQDSLTTGAVRLYKLKENKLIHIAPHTQILDWCISPNGQYAAYTSYDQSAGQVVLMFYDGSLRQIAANIHEIHGISNDGKYIYASQRNGDQDKLLYCLDAEGHKKALGINSAGVSLNADHSQILFSNVDGCYISTCGRRPVKIGSSDLSPLMPPNTRSIEIDGKTTLPAYDLLGQVYLSRHGTSAYYIPQDPKDSYLLAENIDFYTLDETGEYLYFLRDGSICSREAAVRAAQEVLIAQNVSGGSFALSADCTLVYYISGRALHQANAREIDRPVIFPIVSELAENAGTVIIPGQADTIYLLADDFLYAYLSDGSVAFTAAYVFAYDRTANGQLYLQLSGTVFEPGTYIAEGVSVKLLWPSYYHIELT